MVCFSLLFLFFVLICFCFVVVFFRFFLFLFIFDFISFLHLFSSLHPGQVKGDASVSVGRDTDQPTKVLEFVMLIVRP